MYSASYSTPAGTFMDWLRTVLANALFTAAVALIAYSLIYTYQLKKQETHLKKTEVEAAQRDLRVSQAQNEALKRQAQFLRTQQGIEQLARDKLGLVKPNETTYIVVNIPPSLRAEPKHAAPRQTPAPASEGSTGLMKLLHDFWNGGD